MSGLYETARPLTAPYRTTVRNEGTSFRPAHSSVTGETYLELVSTLPPIGAPPGATASANMPTPEFVLFSPGSRRRRRGRQAMTTQTSPCSFEDTGTFSLNRTLTSFTSTGGGHSRGGRKQVAPVGKAAARVDPAKWCCGHAQLLRSSA